MLIQVRGRNYKTILSINGLLMDNSRVNNHAWTKNYTLVREKQAKVHISNVIVLKTLNERKAQNISAGNDSSL
jgi:hypothetical protein